MVWYKNFLSVLEAKIQNIQAISFSLLFDKRHLQMSVCNNNLDMQSLYLFLFNDTLSNSTV